MHKKWTWLLMGFAIAMAMTAISQAQGDLSVEAARAKDLIFQGRQALGGDVRLNEISSITATGTVSVSGVEKKTEGKMKLHFVLKGEDGAFKVDGDHEIFMKRIPEGEAGVWQGEHGERGKIIIRESKKSEGGENAKADHIIIRRAPLGEGETWTDKDSKVIVGEGKDGKKRIMIRKHAIEGPGDGLMMKHIAVLGPGGSPHMLGWFLKPAFPVDFVYSGDAEDGRADAVSIKEPKGGELLGRVLLDKATRLPIGVDYRGFDEPQMIFVRVDKNKAGKEKIDVEVEGPTHNVRVPAPELADIQYRFSDHRMVDGVMLPYRIVKSVNGKVVQETVIESYEIK